MKFSRLEKKSIFYSGIVRRFVIYILIFSAIITLLLTAIQIYSDYKSGLNTIEESINQIEKSYLDGIINSVWLYDTEFLAIQLEGMLKLNDMQYIDVVIDGKTLIKVGDFQDQQTITKTFSLSYFYNNKTISLGSLRVVYTLKNLYHLLAKKAVFIIISQSVVILLVSGFIFFIFYLFIARHLHSMADYAVSLNFKTLDNPFVLNRRQRKTNDEFDLLVTAINDMRMNLHSSYHQLQNETYEHKQSKEKLQESEERYRQLAENINEVFWIVSPDWGQVFYISPAFEKIWGKSCESLYNNPLSWIDPIEKGDRKKVLHFIGEKSKGEWSDIIFPEFKVLRGDGSYRWILARGFPVRNDQGRVEKIVGIAENITERKLAEQKLHKAHIELEHKVKDRTEELMSEIDERKQIETYLFEAKQEAEFANRAKSEFLSNISHELRTPMHQILSYSKFGVDKVDKVKKERLLHYFSKIGIIGKNLLSLLNDLLDLSKLESGKMDYDMQNHDLKKVIKDVANEFTLLLSEKELSLNIIEKDIAAEITCDKYKIGQVMRNFLSNAIKFTPTGKMISILLEPGELINEQSISKLKKVPAACITVKDQGIGIPEDELKSIFNKFIQSSKTKTNAGGTGLGLSICQKIIKDHHGKIWAENNPEAGSTFSFLLPISDEQL